ncbi:right-handed parallel beta-helix repeat-containing protein [Uliginosibacterium sediminicola]|uniref:Pel9A-like right handed beta-helix region domain-containing protein n=1 Tax=Uliginosibacterium sediminicola TaxID=2024550 RepID=A0ABU9Z2W6_9RHOO
MNTLFSKLLGTALLCVLPLATHAKVFFVSPSGSDTAAGTLAAPWKSLARAQQDVAAGDTVYLRGGTYSFTNTLRSCTSTSDTVAVISLSKSGTADQPIRYWAYENEKPVFDFSQVSANCKVVGIDISASWVYLKGIEIKGAHKTSSVSSEDCGVSISGQSNVLQNLDIHNVKGSAVRIKNGKKNLIEDCSQHHNYKDISTETPCSSSASSGGKHSVKDGSGNVFRNCSSWSNSVQDCKSSSSSSSRSSSSLSSKGKEHCASSSSSSVASSSSSSSSSIELY